MPGYPHLYVVFFRPRYGNYQHWILFIEDGTDKMTLEVVGHHPNFERNYLQVDPARSRNYSRKQFVGVLTKADIERVKAGYVLEILDALVEEYILDEDDEEYMDAPSIMKEKRGAIL